MAGYLAELLLGLGVGLTCYGRSPPQAAELNQLQSSILERVLTVSSPPGLPGKSYQ
jgi:hypothetical protein